ncbi:unnamed protein product [Didymodactylos carnosus]|uniref:ETS domain-containing protein n=1 Tax=Didymodactylos carnosus TaxID=1234261 RepID=A0A816BG92_9BILA|nr:unnamed protein product [Didymodactylos carnosus]CAF1610027.1 unnamed protein product [Didymodactylos carnosus]CAF3751824.1 unnamed protein product [Didymodactylos carnosus]CAF4492719.1 unnamed protein product [Didymodactylos carnosus]
MFAAQSPFSSQFSLDESGSELFKFEWDFDCQQQEFSNEEPFCSCTDIFQPKSNTTWYTHSGYFEHPYFPQLFLDDQEEAIFPVDVTTLLQALATPQYCSASPSNGITSCQDNIVHQHQHEAQNLTDQMCSLSAVEVSNKLSEKLNGSSSNFPTSMDDFTLLPTAPTRKSSRLDNTADWLVVDGTTKLKRRPLLHEFLRRLLDNPEYHDLATYVDPQQGIFRLHKPDEVADLWKSVKGRNSKKRMTVDNFSRGIRYYYRKEVMKASPGHFTFCFGPQSGFGKLWRPCSQ